MFSSNDDCPDITIKIALNINNENINQNEKEQKINSISFPTNDDNNKNNTTIKSFNKINRQALKSIENTLLAKNNIDKNIIAETAFKQPKSFNNNDKIFKTLNKPSNNYSFNPFTYPKEEKYSLLKMKKIKSNKFSPYKSTNHLYNKVENTFDKEKNDSKLLYYKIKKNKKVYSLTKAYISNISFKDENNIIKEFKLFRDCDIGLNDGQKIKKQFEDFDVDSDDEVIKQGVNRCIKQIGTAIEMLKNKNKEYTGEYMKYLKINDQ